MRIGDKVRLLRGTEEGRIVSIKDNKFVEIEIEDGFIIPALKNEVVVISKGETEYFGSEEEENEKSQSPERNEPSLEEGVYLGFKKSQNDQFNVWILNQTGHRILFSLSQNDKKTIFGKASGSCEAYDMQQLGEFTSSIFNESKRLLAHLIFHEKETKFKKQPETHVVSINSDQLKEKTYLSSISEEIALVKLGEIMHRTIDPVALKNRMMESRPKVTKEKESRPKKDEHTVDLHIDEFSSGIPSGEILDHQLNEFEKAYDAALLMNVKKLKVIHGIGNGVLRDEIHKRISKKLEVSYYEDADKDKFGYGATIIYF